jgi:HK97 gp10 family phage protein
MARSRAELDPKFRRLMQRLDRDMVDPLKREIAASGRKVYEDAFGNVPVDTGDLRDALGFRMGSAGLAAEIGYDPKAFKAKWRKAGWRAHFVHNGTQGYKAGERRRSGRTSTRVAKDIPARPARPFLRDAFDKNREEILQRHRAAVAEVLKKASNDG